MKLSYTQCYKEITTNFGLPDYYTFKADYYTFLEVHSQVGLFFDNGKPFKNDEKCFLFHLKNSFCSQHV